ncbi:MAG: hypothetical protein ACI9VR_004511 [Cognaticolwellia sp.]|jgi:hypothetical protein
MTLRRQRHGGAAVELALTFSLVLFPLIVGTIEAGIYVHQLDAVAESVLVAGRAAAGVAIEDDPALVFETQLEAELSARGLSPSPYLDNHTVSSAVSGDAPSQELSVDVSFDYGGIVGFLPTPDWIRVRRDFRLEDQVEYAE